jgi:hypothetical protein
MTLNEFGHHSLRMSSQPDSRTSSQGCGGKQG